MPETKCPFCRLEKTARVVEKLGTMVAIKDKHPVTESHMLVLPIRHTPDFLSLTSQEKRDAEALILSLKEQITEKDPRVTGFNIGVNCGVSAGQTIMHAHIHLIPRRDGDTPNPRGGVRGVIPGKRSY